MPYPRILHTLIHVQRFATLKKLGSKLLRELPEWLTAPKAVRFKCISSYLPLLTRYAIAPIPEGTFDARDLPKRCVF